MDSAKKRTPDYTDIAYREAVARLRYLLAESYSPQATPTKIPHVHSTKPEDSGDETDASMAVSDRSRHQHALTPYRAPYYGVKRSLYTDSLPKLPPPSASTLHVPKSAEVTANVTSTPKPEGQQPPPELMAFIERQEDYIEQLEKESQYCREELTNLLSKVKDVISENEGLHEKEKSGILKSVFDYLTSGGEEEDEDDEEDDMEEKQDKKKSPSKKKRLEGPSIVFESRISELEAQLTQTKIDLRKAQEEAEVYKKKLADIQPGSSDFPSLPNTESYKQQIETLLREKEELADNLAKLSSAISQMRDKEADASHKVKRSFDLVDQAQFEKAQAELEVRRLKDELERQHEKLRDLLQEQGRRVQDERSQAERRYAQQVEQLTADLTNQWDAAGKLQLELEKQKRTESELRRELQQKNIIIEELKKELQTKIAGLQTEATHSAAERGSLEQELAASRLTAERAEREARQESARLQAEVTALRQRLDRSDADLLHSRRENLRLSEQIASLERELNLAKMMKESSDKVPGEPSSSPSKHSREKELTSMIMDMEAKHVHTVGELESMIQSQTQLMEKLKDECHSLTQKLEESSARHKEEKATLKVEKAVLLNKLEQVWINCKELQRKNLELGGFNGGQSPGSPRQTTPILRAKSQDPSMALSLSSSTNHGQVMSLSKNMCHSPTIPRQSSSLSKNMSHNPQTNNFSHNLNTSLKHNISHIRNTSLEENISHNQNMLRNQATNLSQIMASCPTVTSSQDTNNIQNTFHSLPTAMTSHSPIMEQGLSSHLNSMNRNTIQNPTSQQPLRLSHCLDNNQVVKNHLPHQELLHAPCPGSRRAQNNNLSHQAVLQNHVFDNRVQNSPLSHQRIQHNQASDSRAQNSHHDHQTEPLTHLDNNQALKCSPLMKHQEKYHKNQPQTPNLISDPNKAQNLSRVESQLNSNSNQTAVNRCWMLGTNQTLRRHSQVVNNRVLSPGYSRNLACLFRGHPPLSSRRREVDHPPLTLEDLATDSDSLESQSAQLQIFK